MHEGRKNAISMSHMKRTTMKRMNWGIDNAVLKSLIAPRKVQ